LYLFFSSITSCLHSKDKNPHPMGEKAVRFAILVWLSHIFIANHQFYAILFV